MRAEARWRSVAFGSGRKVKIFARLLMVICLMLAATGVPAQMQARPTPSAAPPTRSDPPENPELIGFTRAVLLQANSFQAADFRRLANTTHEALDQLSSLQQLLASANETTRLSDPVNTLDYAMLETTSGTTRFLHSFSEPQKDGLKDLSRKTGKSNDLVGKSWAALKHLLDPTKKQYAAAVEEAVKLKDALLGLQSQQNNLATEMSISPAVASSAATPSSSGAPKPPRSDAASTPNTSDSASGSASKPALPGGSSTGLPGSASRLPVFPGTSGNVSDGLPRAQPQPQP